MISLQKYPDILNAIIPISRFKKGEASKLFVEVIQAGIKIVVKNNKPACVLLSPEEYQRILNDMEDYVLLKEALQRLENLDSLSNITQEELLEKYKIPQNLLDETEVDFE